MEIRNVCRKCARETTWKVYGPSKVGEGNEVIQLSRILRKLSCVVDE